MTTVIELLIEIFVKCLFDWQGGERMDLNASLHMIAMECKEKGHVLMEDLEKLKNGNLSEKEATTDLKCFAKCVLEKAKFIVDGKPNMENIRKVLNTHHTPEFADKLVSTCGAVDDADPCNLAFKLTTCYYKYFTEKPNMPATA